VRKNKKIILGVIAAVLLIGLILGGKYVLDLMYYKDAMATVSISNVDVKGVDDGTYVGSYDAKIISATVSVTVKDGKMTDIELLEHQYERGGSAVAIVDEILNKQSLEVDTVKGIINICDPS